MCGIIGIFDRSGDSIDPNLVERMTASIQHRGPDGTGLYIDHSIGLGHRRLSIIDLEGGSQPISNEDGSMLIVFNGEIYNFVELRDELQKLGHVFRTHSDTEVIIHAYEQWNVSCLSRLNGMFSFAIWNTIKRELLLARDHLGIKPLYHTAVGNSILFASEIKALLLHPTVARAIDLESLAELFTFRYVPSPKTLFQRISKLPPGHYMRVTTANIEVRRFWQSVPHLRQSWNESSLIDEYTHLLEDAVRLQMRSDVPVGLFLSSGVDSGALLALMSRHSAGPVQTFTIGFDGGTDTNEVDDARAMAKRFGAAHHFMEVTASDYSNYFERYMLDLEEPVGHEPAAAFYFVAKLTSEKVKVALTGQGADEAWAGYDRYIGVRYSDYYSRLPGLLTRGLFPLIARLPGRMARFKRGVASLSEPDMLTRFTKVYSFFSAEMKACLYKDSLRDRFLADNFGTRSAISHLQSDVSHLDPLSQMLYIDTRANLPDDLLMVADKTSMANSLEVRVPFLDYRLIQFVESLPPSLKLKGLSGKYLHKKAMLKWLPSETVYRKKKGFAHPIAKWMRTSLKPLIDDCLLSSKSSLHQYFDRSYIQKIVTQDRQGSEDYMRQLYLLLSLELWHRAFLTK